VSWSVGSRHLKLNFKWREPTDHDTLVYKRACELNKSHIITTDEDSGLRIESFAVINLRGVSTNKTIIFKYVSIGSPKWRVECTNNASKCQFALSSPHSFVICRAPQALNWKAVLIYIDYTYNLYIPNTYRYNLYISNCFSNWVLEARDKWQRNGASLMQIDIWKHYWCILHAVLGCLWCIWIDYCRHSNHIAKSWALANFMNKYREYRLLISSWRLELGIRWKPNPHPPLII
jgi:hypothetical protein